MLDNHKHSSLRIGLVLPSTPGYSETFFNSKIKGLQERGFYIVLFVQSHNENFSTCPVSKSPKVYKNVVLQVISIIFVFLNLLPRLNSVLRFIKLERNLNTSPNRLLKKIYLNSHILSHKLDWLHFGFTTQALESELVAKAIGAKMAVSFRGFDINVYPVKHPNCYDLVWKHVDKVHSISNDLLNKAYDLGLNKEKPFSIITPAVDITHFNSVETSKVHNKVLQIVTVARMNWIKGLDHALNAMKILKDEGIWFEYNIIGSGASTEIERYTFQIHQNKLQNQVILHGRLSHQDTLSKLKEADVYLQPSIQEGFCNAVLEAQALGLLCITTDAGALPENVIHESTGWVVAKRQPSLIANKIIEVKNMTEDEKKLISKNAINRVQQNFNLKEQQKQFADFYLAND